MNASSILGETKGKREKCDRHGIGHERRLNHGQRGKNGKNGKRGTKTPSELRADLEGVMSERRVIHTD